MIDRTTLPDHAPYSPSAMARIIQCPLSVSLSEQAPAEPESAYAAEGTNAHEVAEDLLLGDEKIFKFNVPQEMFDAAQVYFDHCDPLLEQASTYGIEFKAVIDEELFGSIDCYAVVDNHLHVIDFKYGAGVMVSPNRNKQLMTYAACLFLDEEVDLPTVAGVTLTIIQPRAPGKAVQSWKCKPRDIDEHLQLVDGAINSAKMKNPPGRMGEWCRFCKAKIICPVIAAAESGVVNWKPNDLDLGDLGQLLLQAQVLEARAKALFTYAHARMEDGNKIPGWKLVAKRAQRKWTDEDAVKRWGKKHGMLKKLQKITLLSPAQIGKILGDDYDSLSHLVESVSSGTNLKQDDDPAEEVQSLGNALEAIGSLT